LSSQKTRPRAGVARPVEVADSARGQRQANGTGGEPRTCDQILYRQPVLKGLRRTEDCPFLRTFGRNPCFGKEDLLSSGRQPRIARGRALYCYLRKAAGGVNGAILMKELKISSGAASYLAHKDREIVKVEHLSTSPYWQFFSTHVSRSCLHWPVFLHRWYVSKDLLHIIFC